MTRNVHYILNLQNEVQIDEQHHKKKKNRKPKHEEVEQEQDLLGSGQDGEEDDGLRSDYFVNLLLQSAFTDQDEELLQSEPLDEKYLFLTRKPLFEHLDINYIWSIPTFRCKFTFYSINFIKKSI